MLYSCTHMATVGFKGLTGHQLTEGRFVTASVHSTIDSPDDVLRAVSIARLQHLHKLFVHSFNDRQYTAADVVGWPLQHIN